MMCVKIDTYLVMYIQSLDVEGSRKYFSSTTLVVLSKVFGVVTVPFKLKL